MRLVCLREIKRVTLVFFFFCLISPFRLSSGIYNPAYARSMILIDSNNKVDPVSGQPVTRKRYKTSFNGKLYWFISYANLRAFKSNPAKYAERLKALEEKYKANPSEYIKQLNSSSVDAILGKRSKKYGY